MWINKVLMFALSNMFLSVADLHL